MKTYFLLFMAIFFLPSCGGSTNSVPSIKKNVLLWDISSKTNNHIDISGGSFFEKRYKEGDLYIKANHNVLSSLNVGDTIIVRSSLTDEYQYELKSILKTSRGKVISGENNKNGYNYKISILLNKNIGGSFITPDNNIFNYQTQIVNNENYGLVWKTLPPQRRYDNHENSISIETLNGY